MGLGSGESCRIIVDIADRYITGSLGRLENQAWNTGKSQRKLGMAKTPPQKESIQAAAVKAITTGDWPLSHRIP